MKRWTRVGVLTLVLLAINLVARLVSRLGGFTEISTMDIVAIVGMIAIGLATAGAGVWWALLHPFSRVFFDIGAAIVVANLLILLVGPFVSGKLPFEGGLAVFVGQFLIFLGVAAAGGLLGFVGTVALGKDWKSRGLRRFEESHRVRRVRA